ATPQRSTIQINAIEDIEFHIVLNIPMIIS
ncbi:unnamed protein product, partial [marine sediment metagenome]